MKHFFTTVKIIYFIVTMVVAVFFLRGNLLLGDGYTTILWYIMPGYLFLSGIMIGYIITKLRMIININPEFEQRIYLQGFIIGIIIGIGLAITYVALN